MYVWAELGVEGARRAAARGDVTVLVDALRSSVTITAALAAGARRVIPVRTVEEARAYLARPGFRVAGERGGAQVPGFDYGNSPSQLLRHAEQIRDQTLILTTSNGTPCIQAAREGARALLVGSLPNAAAVTTTAFILAQAHGCDIALLAAGGDGRPAVEDDLAVAALAAALAARGAEADIPPPSIPAPAESTFRDGPNGRRLAELGYAEDVALCARTDLFGVVGVLQGGEGFALGDPQQVGIASHE